MDVFVTNISSFVLVGCGGHIMDFSYWFSFSLFYFCTLHELRQPFCHI